MSEEEYLREQLTVARRRLRNHSAEYIINRGMAAFWLALPYVALGAGYVLGSHPPKDSDYAGLEKITQGLKLALAFGAITIPPSIYFAIARMAEYNDRGRMIGVYKNRVKEIKQKLKKAE